MLSTDNDSGDIRVSLVDYGFARRYKVNNVHVSKYQKREVFQGNLLFASASSLDFNETTRKDDLFAIMYLMFYMLNNQNLPDFDKMGLAVKEKMHEVESMLKYK